MEPTLSSTYFIDKDHPEVISFSDLSCKGLTSDMDKAVSLYYAIRDKIRYNPYTMDLDKSAMRASQVLKKGEGYCVAKAILLAACVRSQGIPARLGFADVRNHLTTERLRTMMGSDLFIWHGYTDIFLAGKWVKATPAFNLSLCENFNVQPLEFDGHHDSIFHPFDTLGNQHMEYVADHGSFDDLPWDRIMADALKAYPRYFEFLDRKPGDFSVEAQKENR